MGDNAGHDRHRRQALQAGLHDEILGPLLLAVVVRQVGATERQQGGEATRDFRRFGFDRFQGVKIESAGRMIAVNGSSAIVIALTDTWQPVVPA